MKLIFFKTLFIMAFAIGLFANSLFAQKTYATINAQYGLSMKNSYSSNSITTTSTTLTLENVNSSLGKGLNAGGAFGYMFTKNIGVELGVSYLLGAKREIKYNANNQIDNRITSSKMLQINPSLIIASSVFKKINPYAKLGLVIGSGSIFNESNVNDKGTGKITLMESKYNGGLAFGLNAGVGVLYSLTAKMSLFGQLNMMNMTYAPTKGETTKWTENGKDLLASKSVSDKEGEFVDSYVYDSSNPPSGSQPYKDLKSNYPFNSFGLSFGLKYGF